MSSSIVLDSLSSFGTFFEVDSFYLTESKVSSSSKVELEFSVEAAKKFKEYLDSREGEYAHFKYLSSYGATISISGVFRIDTVSYTEIGQIFLPLV